MKNGAMANAQLTNYTIPTTLDTPSMDVHIVENAFPEGPFGAKGLGERTVLSGHALKNALLPILTVVSFQFGFLLGGAVLTETVFSWPGVGLALYNAISFRDYPLVQGGVLVVAVAFVVVNLATDLLYAFADPRIKYS